MSAKLAQALKLARGRLEAYLHQQEAYGYRQARCDGIKQDISEINAVLAAHEAAPQHAGRADAQPVDKLDAERYRWLRDFSVPPHNFYLSVPVEFDGVRYTPDEVDSAIDAAIAMLAARSEKGGA